MARVTVEDCLLHVDNRFDLVMLASKRARQLANGAVEPMLPWENDKPTVMALREIAENLISAETIDRQQNIFEEQKIAQAAANQFSHYVESSTEHSSVTQEKDIDLQDALIEALKATSPEKNQEEAGQLSEKKTDQEQE